MSDKVSAQHGRGDAKPERSSERISQKATSDELGQLRTDYALERTRMAATRTYFSLLRAGLAIAAGGSLVTTILAKDYPDWVVGSLAGVFVVVGFAIMIAGFRRYEAIAKLLAVSDEFDPVPIKLVLALTLLLMAATVAVLVLYLLAQGDVTEPSVIEAGSVKVPDDPDRS